MEKKLPITFEPYEEESLDGYILRLAEANYHQTPEWIRTMMGAMPGTRLQFPRMEVLQALSDITDTQIEKLEYISLRHHTKKQSAQPILFYNRLVPLYFVNKQSSRVCPLCLKEKPFIRQIWDLYSYTSCPQHGIYLLDKCPSCGKKISWSRPSVCFCTCGADLREAGVELADDIKVSTIIFDKLFVERSAEVSSGSTAELISLFSFLKILAIFAALYRGQIDTTGKFLNKYKEPRIMNAALAKAYSLFEDWPNNLINLLDKQLSNSATDASYFKLLCEVFKREFENKDESFIYDAFITYANEHWRGGYISRIRNIDKELKIKRKFISMVDACKILHVRHSTLERLIDEGQIVGDVTAVGSRKRVLIDKESINSFKDKMKRGITLKEAAYRLDIGHESIVDLVRRGFLTALVRPSDGHAAWLICTDSINDLLDNIEKCLLYRNGLTINFYYIMRRLSVHSFSIADVVEEVLSKRLYPAILCPATGLSRFLFLKDDVEKIMIDSLNNKKSKLLTVIDVADILHVKQEVAAFWIDKGFISSSLVRNGDKKKRIVLYKEIEDFNKKYIIGVQAARLYNISAKKLVSVLEKRDILPVSGPSIDGGRQYLFYRNFLSESLF